MDKLSFALGGYKFWTNENYLYYRSVYGKSFKVSLSDIDSVSLDTGKRGKNIIKINGGGVTLAEETLPKSWCEKAQFFIQKHIKKSNSGSLDDLEKLSELKEKGIISEEEFQAKKKQILGL
jgi:hypothetical protein